MARYELAKAALSQLFDDIADSICDIRVIIEGKYYLDNYTIGIFKLDRLDNDCQSLSLLRQ